MAEKNLASVHVGFLTKGDADAFLEKSRPSTGYTTKRAAASISGSVRARVANHRRCRDFSAPDCPTVVGWYRKALEMCGMKSVRIVKRNAGRPAGRSVGIA